MFELSQDHEDFRKVVRDFAEKEVAPHLAAWDAAAHFPTDLVPKMGDLGLISPERRGTQRVYHRRDRTRLSLILRGKRLGFPLEEIRTIIDLFDAPRGRRTQLEYVLDQIDERRTDLEQRLRDVQDAIAELGEFEQRCRDDLGRLDHL